MSDNNFTDYLGLAHVATTTPGRTPQYGLVYDLASGRWQSAAQFRQFVRDVTPITQQKYLAEQRVQERETLHTKELREAQMHAKIGVGFTPGEGDNRFELGLKGIGAGVKSLFDLAFAGPGEGAIRTADESDYKIYAAHGGLLTKDEFMSFGGGTRAWLLDRAVGGERQKASAETVMALPGAESIAKGFGTASHAGKTAFDVIGGSGIIPVIPKDKGGSIADIVSPDEWRQAWKESDRRSLGNMILDQELSPLVSQDTLARWKRENSWYQMSSVGAELTALWHADPTVLVGKGLGGAARLRKGELPIKEDSAYAQGLRQALQRERITVRNPVTRKLIDWRAPTFQKQWDEVRDYAEVATDAEVADLPMLQAQSRVMDGGAAGYAISYAAKRRAEINAALDTPRMKGALQEVADANQFDLPENLDIWDLTQQLLMGDPKAEAMLAKMQQIAPDELAEYAPNAQTLIESVNALKTKNDVLQSEVDDLLKKADDLGEAPSPFHRWEIDTDLRIKQQQLAEANDALEKYQGYKDWLDLVTPAELGGKARPRVSRVSGPSRTRWSEVRANATEDTESHHLFKPDPFGVAHTVSKMPRAFFMRRTSTAELHDIDSTLQSVDSQFDQFEQLFDYAPEGARDAIKSRIVHASDPMERYRALYELENTHLVNGLAHKFGIDPEVSRQILNKIQTEQRRSQEAILTGQGQVYRSQPTLADRITGKNADIKLVEKSKDGDYYTIDLMHGRRKATYVVPKEALQPRVAPEDVTQTPNYYTPMDTRRIYHEFKHHKDLLYELNKGFLSHGKARLLADAESVGEMFNRLWKPAMLFRFAWPQRVLMDEGARAVAIFGPSYWLTGAGAEAVGTSLRNVLPNTVRFFDRRRHGALGISLNDGPVSVGAERSADPFAREAEVRSAPSIPQSLWPKVDAGRRAKIDGHNLTWDDYTGLQRRVAFWLDQNNPARATTTPLNPKLAEGLESYGARQIAEAHNAVEPEHPAKALLNHWREWTKDGTDPKATQEGPRFFDPVSGKRVRTGHLVLLDPENAFSVGFRGVDDANAGAVAWYKKNAEMLSRAGIRIVVTPQGELALARWFPTNRYRDAAAFLEFASDAHPSLLYSPHKGDDFWTAITNSDEESPFTQASYRQFISDPLKEEVKGDAPIKGEHGVTAYHGTNDELPDDLLPRDQVDARNGNMVGRGLYTTVSRQVADTYGATNLYVVKGSKSGKRYKTFDLDRPINDADVKAFDRWAAKHERESWFDVHEANMIRSNLADRTHLNEGTLRRHLTETKFNDDETIAKTWANLYEDMQDPFSGSSTAHDLLDRFLEDAHGAGVKTHLGGTTYGADHRVYVFLRPEDIVISPRWAPTGKFDTIPAWFSNPLSVENPIPQNRIIRRKTDNRQPIAELENPVPSRVNGEIRAQEREVEDIDHMGTFDAGIDDPTDWVLRKIRERRELGVKHKVLTSADGKSVVTEGAFAGHRGEVFRGLTSSNRAIDILTEGHGGGLSLGRRQSEGHKVYHAPKISDRAIKDHKSVEHKEARLYFQVLADTVNDHIGNSPIWQRMLRGQSDDQIIDFLENTPQGARIVDEIKPKGLPTGVWVEDHRFLLNRYVPSQELQRRLAKGRLQPSDFRKKIADEKLPDIYGPDLEVLDRRRKTGEWLSDAADRFYDFLGTKPIDALSRQPFFKAMYDMKMRSLIGSTDSKWLDGAKLERFQAESQEFAKQQVQRFLYNLTDSTNMTDALRFVAPFWGAQYEAITKWLRIISDRPETVGRYFVGQAAVYRNMEVVDENGNPVHTGIRPGGLMNLGIYHPSDRVIVPVGFLSKIPGLGALKNFSKIGIPIGSANTVLQGDLPLMPSLGPLATIPADLFLKHTSDTYGTEFSDDFWYRWFFPVGRSRDKNDLMRVVDSISPGWIRRVMQASDEDGQAFMNTQMQVAREMLTKARRDGKPDPTPEQIQAAAKHLYAIRSVASYVLPFQTQFLPKHQYWVDAAHRYQKEYGSEWWDKFVDDYHEEAAIYASSSTNSVGVPPTKEGMEDWATNKKLIAKYPNWTEAIISPEAYMGDFSSDAYGAQLAITLGPGTGQTLRSTTDLRERLYTDPETKLGWREYRKLSAAVEAELFARGLTNIQQSGAEDLVQIKRAGIADLFSKYPSWARAYQRRSDEIYSDVEELKKIAYRPEFDSRPDFQGVRQYLEIRQKVANTLDEIGAAGGSRSLQADANAPLAQYFYDQVGQLVLSNPAFAEFYSRYLDADDLSLGGGGF